MRQRVVIAMALALRPKVLIADEPTTALDVTIQQQIIALVARLREQLAMGVVWVTHDLGVVARVAQRVLVMYAGHVVEEGPAAAVFAAPGTSLHRRSAGGDPSRERRRAPPAAADPRGPAGPVEDARRVSLRTALPVRRRALPSGDAAAHRPPRQPRRLLGRSRRLERPAWPGSAMKGWREGRVTMRVSER